MDLLLRLVRAPVQLIRCVVRRKREISSRDKILFRDFWAPDEHGDKIKFFLRDLLMQSSENNCQVHLYSDYPEFNSKLEKFVDTVFSRLNTSAKLPVVKIWYTAENVRTPFNRGYDLHIGFDFEDFGDTVVYLPLWVIEMGKTLAEAKEVQKSLMMSCQVPEDHRKFACIVINNPEPTRMRFLAELQKIGVVDCFGKAFNKPIENKMNLISEYDFNVCFENDLFPGYITEKVVQAYLAGCIPIYYGQDSLAHLNPKAIINVAELGFKNALEKIIEIKDSRSLMYKTRSEQLISTPFDFFELETKIKLGFKKALETKLGDFR